MKIKAVPIIIIILAVIVGILVAGPFFVVDEGEQVVVVQFGRLVRVVPDAGLHLKAPFIDTIVRYPKRIMAWDGEQKSMPTKEKQYIWVDVTARWKISDPAKFYESVSTLTGASSKLDDIIDSEVRTVVAENDLRESVRNSNLVIDRTSVVYSNDNTAEAQQNQEDEETLLESLSASELGGIMTPESNTQPIQRGRRRLAEEILSRSRKIVSEYGIDLIDVVTRQIRYSDELTQSVYARMIKERNQIAQAFRSEGEGRKAEWLGKTDNEERSILSGAYETAEKIKGDADAQASAIYAGAYNKDRSFFEFWRAIESYRNTVPGFDKTLSTNMDYFRYLYSPQGR
ncbi:MAG: protease modulator HflC [Termitinemataceae bacterium]|nr:MAG: protease modulator HflC [Termitinemataceae bacterium]